MPSGTHTRLRWSEAASIRESLSRLGHATVSITLDTYSHAIPAMQEEEEAERIAGLVFAGQQSTRYPPLLGGYR